MDENLPPYTSFLLTYPQNDCFFIVGSVSGSIEPERIGALKIFLMAYSEPLRNMLEESALAEPGDVALTDVKPETFKNFLKCIYGGSQIVIPKLSFGKCANLLYLVEKYLVTHLKAELIEHMIGLLCRGTLFTALLHPVCFQDEKLEKAIAKQVGSHALSLFSDDLFLKLGSESILWILQLEFLNTSETALWDAILKWAKHCTGTTVGKELRKHLIEHLKYIRFCSMHCETFCKKVVPEDILTPDEVYNICKTFGTKADPDFEHLCNITTARKRLRQETTFYHIVNNVNSLEETNFSGKFCFQTFFWKILVGKKNNHLKFFLVCEPDPAYINNWSVVAGAELILVNQCGKAHFTRSVKHTFNKDENDWGYSSFYPWEDLMNPVNGFFKDDTILLKVEITV